MLHPGLWLQAAALGLVHLAAWMWHTLQRCVTATVVACYTWLPPWLGGSGGQPWWRYCNAHDLTITAPRQRLFTGIDLPGPPSLLCDRLLALHAYQWLLAALNTAAALVLVAVLLRCACYCRWWAWLRCCCCCCGGGSLWPHPRSRSMRGAAADGWPHPQAGWMAAVWRLLHGSPWAVGAPTVHDAAPPFTAPTVTWAYPHGRVAAWGDGTAPPPVRGAAYADPTARATAVTDATAAAEDGGSRGRARPDLEMYI